MKLIVSHLEAVRTYVTRELYYIQHDLITNHGWRHIEANSLWHGAGSLEHKLRIAFGKLPELIIFWEAYELVYRYAREMQGPEVPQVFLRRRSTLVEPAHARNQGDCFRACQT